MGETPMLRKENTRNSSVNPTHLQTLLAAYLPMLGGILLTLISFGIIGKKWQIADPDLEEMWSDSLKLMRFGGPALILIGIFATAYMILAS
jgi:hypothetical protein